MGGARVTVPEVAATPADLEALRDELNAALADLADELAALETRGVGGVLSGNLPNPGFAVNMAEQGELDGERTERIAADDAEEAARLQGDADVAQDAADAFTSAQNQINAITDQIADIVSDLAAKYGQAEVDAAIETAVDAAIAALIDSAPDALNTLRELGEALADQDDAVAALTAVVATKATQAGLDALNATVVALTATVGTKATQAALQAAIDTHTADMATVGGIFASIDHRIGVFEKQTIVKLAAKFVSAHQEGGKTIMQGEFTPDANGTGVVSFDIDVSAYSAGWGGALLVFNIGVLPVVPPTPAETSSSAGSKRSKITNVASNSSSTPLAGVTEYSQEILGHMPASGVICGKVRQEIIKTGLTPGRVYQWELRMGGVSFYKELVFPAGWIPKYLAAIPGDESYVMVGCTGQNKVSMVALGWSPIWSYVGTPVDMQRHADITVPSPILGLEMQSGANARYAAAVHTQTITIIDTWTLTIVGTYSIGHNTMSLRPDRSGLYFWLGCANGHLHRFNLATMAFDQVNNMPAADFVRPLGASTNDGFMWVAAIVVPKLYKFFPATQTWSAAINTPLLPGGANASISEGDTLGDGRAVVADVVNGALYTIDANGNQLYYVDITNGGGASGNVKIAPRDERVFVTRGTKTGWFWIDPLAKINFSAFGMSTAQPFGDIESTDHEGTMVAIPGDNKVINWPGGDLTIDPTGADPVSYGAQHAHVHVQGATINGG